MVDFVVVTGKGEMSESIRMDLGNNFEVKFQEVSFEPLVEIVLFQQMYI